MSTIPYMAQPVSLEPIEEREGTLLMGPLVFVCAELAMLLLLGLGPLKNFWIMLVALFPLMVASLFQPFVGICGLYAFTIFDEQVAVATGFTSSKMLAICVAVAVAQPL